MNFPRIAGPGRDCCRETAGMPAPRLTQGTAVCNILYVNPSQIQDTRVSSLQRDGNLKSAQKRLFGLTSWLDWDITPARGAQSGLDATGAAPLDPVSALAPLHGGAAVRSGATPCLAVVRRTGGWPQRVRRSSRRRRAGGWSHWRGGGWYSRAM